MKITLRALATILSLLAAAAPAAEPASRPVSVDLSDFKPAADGQTDDTPALQACFEAISKAGGGVIRIPPGDYFISGKTPIPLASNTSVNAHGARFHLPKTLGDRARIVVFAGQDISDFTWIGGHFKGRCFDPAAMDNTWEPNANTRMIVITTTPGGKTSRLTFRDITSDRIAGAVIDVQGVPRKGSESEVDTFATHITLDNCTLLNSGKFMWDYGYLWQITVWPEDHEPREHAMAAKYFRNDLVRASLKIEAGDDRIWIDNAKKPVSITNPNQWTPGICFFGQDLPPQIVRGKRYFVVESTPTFIRIADQARGPAIKFSAPAGPGAKLISSLFDAFPALYAPTGAGPGKGAFDLTCCREVRVTGCKLSALGDTMHIQRSHNIVFANNHITGSRMGAFFLAEYCVNATITGNTIDGTNGSRVMSVEKNARDVTIIGNTFRNGGRGSWINQPTNLILQGNIFINNTTKCEPNPKRGRRSWLTGDYEQYAEIYFTTHQANGQYGGIVVRDNIIQTGPDCQDTMTFAPGGHDILVTGNIFKGHKRTVKVDEKCSQVIVRDNLGINQ